jgi:hypothetical protein
MLDRTKHQRLAFTYGINPRVSTLVTLSLTLQYLGFAGVQLVSRGQFVTGRRMSNARSRYMTPWIDCCSMFMRRDSTGGARRLSGRSTAPLPRVGQVETPSHYVQEFARERDHRQRDMRAQRAQSPRPSNLRRAR